MNRFLRSSIRVRGSWLVIIVALSTFIFGCKVNRYKNGLKVGKWVEENNIDGVVYKRIEFYKRGAEKGTWKAYSNKRLVFKEKYRDNTSYIKFYHPNGIVSATGKSIKIKEKDNSLHWFYIGEWEYFDTKGNLDLVRIYDGSLNPKEIEIDKK